MDLTLILVILFTAALVALTYGLAKRQRTEAGVDLDVERAAALAAIVRLEQALTGESVASTQAQELASSRLAAARNELGRAETAVQARIAAAYASQGLAALDAG